MTKENVSQCVSTTFLVEVLKKEKCLPTFVVRIPSPNGTGVAAFGTRKELNEFFDSFV